MGSIGLVAQARRQAVLMNRVIAGPNTQGNSKIVEIQY
jgi:hypothetical protein